MSHETSRLQQNLLDLTAEVLSVEYGISIPAGATYIRWQSTPGSMSEVVQFSPLKLAQPQPNAEDIVSAQVAIGDGGEAAWLSRDRELEQSTSFLSYFLERFHDVWQSHDHEVCCAQAAPLQPQTTLFRRRAISGRLIKP